MNALYEIKNNYLDALTKVKIDEETGEIIGFEELDAMKEDFKEKAKNVALFILELDAEEAAIKDIERKYKERRDGVARRKEWLKQYLSENMEQTGTDKLETAEVKVSFRATESVLIHDEFQIPQEYLRIKTTEEADKTAIKKAIKAGATFDFAELVKENKIQIK